MENERNRVDRERRGRWEETGVRISGQDESDLSVVLRSDTKNTKTTASKTLKS